MFQLPGESRLNCWQTVSVVLDDPIGHIVDSQSNLSQISEGCCNLVCAALHPLEMKIADRSLLHEVSYLMPKYVNRDQLKQIASGETPYLQLLKQEYENLTRVMSNPDAKAGAAKSVKVLQSFRDYDPDDMETLHLLFSVEGAHAFYYGRNERDDVNRILHNLEQFVRSEQSPRLLYLTVTHLTQNVFCNHAFGIKIFDKDEFIPSGNGLQEAGRELIRKCYEELPYRLLIDTRHMSLKSRLMLYDFRRENGWNGIPLIASHAGVTGCSYRRMPERKVETHAEKNYIKVVYDKPEGHLPDTLFNPTSINLYDEDIAEILLSGGLIGVSFDERILGAEVKLLIGQKAVEKEFVSVHESELFCGEQVRAYEEEEHMEEEEDENSRSILRLNFHQLQELHLRHLVNTIFHIVKVGEELKEVDPWEHICIGSDFDGLINPIKACVSSSHFCELPDKLKQAFEEYTPGAGFSVRNIEQVVENIMFRNGYNFLKKHFL
ncbi:membrane dipeptidase [Pontibacter diazotrophicus]|nr:membrane dipeptidase [Pontibacter diazotrophicus]